MIDLLSVLISNPRVPEAASQVLPVISNTVHKTLPRNRRAVRPAT